MASHVAGSAAARLEGSCAATQADWIRIAPAGRGFERMEACFAAHAFAPHRHDSYAIGFTLEGVQSFRYRGARKHSLPGQLFVLHPDEIHDGSAGTSAGFRYRILYVEPRALQEAAGEARRPLPFVREPVSSDRRLAAAIGPALADLERAPEELERDQLLVELAAALAAADPSIARRPLPARHWRAVGRAREFLDAHLDKIVTSAELEAVTGLSRYEAARQFRACLGTSPYRYLVLRRLDRARALIRQGTRLVDAALACGFADQSHLTRHFKRAYGISPGRWAAISRRGAAAG